MRHNDILVYSFLGFPAASTVMVLYLDKSESLWCMCVGLFSLFLPWLITTKFLPCLITTKFLNLALLLSSGELMKPTLFGLLDWANLYLGIHCTFVWWWKQSHPVKCACKATIIWWKVSSICDSLMYYGISPWNNVYAIPWPPSFTARHLLSIGSNVK